MGCIMFQVHELDVLAPFDFKTNPSWHNIYYKVLLVSTEVTYFVCGLLFVPVAEEWVWDYAISVTILHVAITSTVMLEFPLTSHWWAALDGHSEILLHRILRLQLHRCDACCLCHGIRLNFNDMWRPDFSILFVQRQLYLSRSG
ncbi:putative transmembrane protein 244 isoform X2 [Aotus nancymaae]|nr:transmembrane protein 244 isoform X2 [Aotus nancymaae]XP_012313778.1 transmembrane protein 244 isoform X2 [Aotus nancymaae]XP_012313779.1 transmembrane protein 244 isoform X2 [Aotus nancymaae]XP_012313780.1 transmembrane protein 244 isoform X2 [Aotus nancymaae]XP_012313781.1 transmembrane protein 244 isoform X2 [Aotus nancymaae]